MPDENKLLQILIFLALITAPYWAGMVFNIDRGGPSIEQIGDQ